MQTVKERLVETPEDLRNAIKEIREIRNVASSNVKNKLRNSSAEFQQLKSNN